MVDGLAIHLAERRLSPINRRVAGQAHTAHTADVEAAEPVAAIHAQRDNGQHAAGGANPVAHALAAASPAGEPAVALLAQLHAAPHRPVEPQAGQEDGQRPQPAPALRPLVGAAGAGVVHAGRPIAVVAVQVIVPRTVIEERLGAAQTGGVVDDGLGAAQARLVAHPGLGQWTRTLARLAPAATAARAHDRIEQRGIAAHHNRSTGSCGSTGSSTAAAAAEELLQGMHMLLLRGGRGLLGDDRRWLGQVQIQSQAETKSRGSWLLELLLELLLFRGGCGGCFAGLQVRM